MGKVKAGDFVRVLGDHPYLDITAYEIGKVSKVGEKGTDGNRQYDVNFTSYDGTLSYGLGLAKTDFEKVGTKIKRKRLNKLEVGDKVLLDGEHGDELLHPEVYTITAVRDHGDHTTHIFATTTPLGESFEVVVPFEDLYKKVPVVV